MKAIGEASIEYVKSNFLLETIWAQETQDAFKSGVEFAQRWTPVEEELPKVEGKYLVIRSGNTEIEQWKITNNKGYWYDYLGITHWRLIEHK